MEDYFVAKRRLFDLEEGTAIVNLDDPYGRRLAGEIDCLTFSASGVAEADYRAEGISLDAGGATFRCIAPSGEVPVRTQMPGPFNVSNALAAIAGAEALGVELRRRARWPAPSACRAASSRSTRASPSRCSSTTRTPPTRSRTYCGPRAD